MSFFSSSKMAHNVDSKDMLHVRCYPKQRQDERFSETRQIPRKWNEYCIQNLVRIVLSL